MDPQQRLLLECSFEALESAGMPKHSVVGHQVGVFIGGSPTEYETHLSRDSDAMPMYQSTGLFWFRDWNPLQVPLVRAERADANHD